MSTYNFVNYITFPIIRESRVSNAIEKPRLSAGLFYYIFDHIFDQKLFQAIKLFSQLPLVERTTLMAGVGFFERLNSMSPKSNKALTSCACQASKYGISTAPLSSCFQSAKLIFGIWVMTTSKIKIFRYFTAAILSYTIPLVPRPKASK